MSRIALVLCGGEGTRFRSISSSPKILAPFRNGLFIDWLVWFLKENNFEKIILSLGYKSDLIINYIDSELKSHKISYIIEDSPLGTGGAVINAIKSLNCDELCVFNGDTFWSNNLTKEFLHKPIDLGLCLTKKFPLNERYGDFSLKNGKLIIKRGSSKIPIVDSKVFIGIARVSKNLKNINLKKPYSFEELLVSQSNGLGLCNFDGDVFDFGVPEAYEIFGELHGI